MGEASCVVVQGGWTTQLCNAKFFPLGDWLTPWPQPQPSALSRNQLRRKNVTLGTLWNKTPHANSQISPLIFQPFVLQFSTPTLDIEGGRQYVLQTTMAASHKMLD